MALPIVPRDLKNPAHYRTSTGVDRLKATSKAQMATNVPVGARNLERIASSVNATMWPKKRVRNSTAEVERINVHTPYRHRRDVTPDTTNRISREAVPMPRMPIVSTNRGATILRYGI